MGHTSYRATEADWSLSVQFAKLVQPMEGRMKKTGKTKKKPASVREAALHPYAIGSEATVKKNLRLHQSKIDAARKALGAATETETIETALDLVVFRRELIDGVRGMQGAELVNYFDE